MARTCMRPGCDRPAAARVAFDPVALQLWLDPLARRSAPVQELCEFHVERLTVPRGWSATDRRPGVVTTATLSLAPDPVAGVDQREPDPALHQPVDPAPEPEAQPEPQPEPEPEAVVEPEPEPEPEPVLESDPEPVEPEPVVSADPAPDPVRAREPEVDDEVHVAPEPVAASAAPSGGDRPRAEPRRRRRTAAPSLLSRAFELTGHQESILTTPSAEADDAPDDPSR